MKSFPTLPCILAAMLLAACTRQLPTQTPRPPSGPIQACAPLDETAPARLRELFTAGTPGLNGEIIALKVPPSSDVILSLHIGNPSLVRWKLFDPASIMQEDLGIVTRIGSGFSQSGDLAMGATRSDKRAGVQESREHVGGVLLWNTQTGGLASCVESPCPSRPPSGLMALPTLVGASLAPDGSIVLIYNELGVTRVTLPGVTFEQVYDNMSPGIPSSDVTTIGFVAFDTTGMRYAVGLEEGGVVVVPTQQHWWAFLRTPLVLGKNDPANLESIADIAFSPDGRWLVEARGGTIRLWNLASASSTESFQIPMPQVSELAFDRTAKYLYAADGRSVVVVDIEAGAVVGHFGTHGISAMTVSPDNRLLIWGDVNGVVHAQGDCGR